MTGHTPWRYLIHKRDGFLARLRKRMGRWKHKRRAVVVLIEPCPDCGFKGPYDGHVCEVLCECGDPENCRYATVEEHAGREAVQ